MFATRSCFREHAGGFALKGCRLCQSIVPTEVSHERLGILRQRILCPSRLLDMERPTPWQGRVLHDLRPDIFNRLGRPGRWLRILLSRPGLELIDQGAGFWLIAPWLNDFWLIDFRLVLKGNFESGKQFIARRGRRQGLDGGG